MIIYNEGSRKERRFLEITDFPYVSSLSPEAKHELEDSLIKKHEGYIKQRIFIARLMAKKAALERKFAERAKAS